MPPTRVSDHRVWTASDVVSTLSVPTAIDHKYSRGVVALRTGSLAYPGAAVLSTEGAARAGAGMVRWLGPTAVGALVLQRRPEVVLVPGRADAWVIGSGTDARTRTDREHQALVPIVSQTVAPLVVDAGALDLITEVKAPFVITPHDRELQEARIPLGLGIDDLASPTLATRLASGFDERLLVARETAIALGGTVLLKGATTIVASPSGWFATVTAGTPWLATAGTGDVLAGVLGSLIAIEAARRGGQGDGLELGADALAPIAATAAWLHGAAGVIASNSADGAPGHPATALDVAAAVPLAIEYALGATVAER